MDNENLIKDAMATLSRYVQFDTTSPPGNEMPAALWLREQLTNRSITRDIKLYEPLIGGVRLSPRLQVRQSEGGSIIRA